MSQQTLLMHNHSNSPDPFDSENAPPLSIETSRADLLKVIVQFLTPYIQLTSCFVDCAAVPS